MKKEYKKVADLAFRQIRPLTQFALGAFMFFCTNTDVLAAETNSYEVTPVVIEHVIREIPMQNEHDLSICVSDNLETTTDKFNLAFEQDNNRKTEEAVKAHSFVLEAVKDVDIEKVKYELNSVLDVANYTMLLPHGLLLSVSKSLETIDDDTLTFSIFHARKLLVSDMVHANVLSEYISNVQSRLNKA